MNIYLITEDGVSFCIQAKTMGEALGVCLQSYLEERQDDSRPYSEADETNYYHEQILQSCQLIGGLRN